MSEIQHTPFREGEPPPSDKHILAKMIDHDGSEELVWVLPDDLKHGPIRDQDFGPLVPVLRWQWRHLQTHLTWCRSFEDWEAGFMRDQSAETEISYWTRITYALLEFAHRHPEADKGALFAALSAISNGQKHRVKPASLRRELKQLMQNPPDVLCGVSNFTPEGQLETEIQHLR